MQRANDLKFDVSNGIRHFTRKCVPGQAGQKDITKVKGGDKVYLQKDDIEIVLKNIKRISDQTYSGQVLSVDPYGALKNDNITEDTEISFSHGHIFSCHH